MAKVKIQGHASGTGILTVTAPDTDVNRTITLPDETGTVSLGVGIDDNATTTAITINASENVGIGATSPSTSLHLKDNTTGANTKLTVERSALSYTGEYAASHCGTVTNNEFDLHTNDTLRLRLTNDGRGLSEFTAKVWAKFSGAGTPAFVASHNCSSITDNSTGNYTINFTNNLANVNYSLTTASQNWSIASDEWRLVSPYSMAVGSVGIQTVESYGGELRLVDHTECMLQIFGD